MNRTFLLLAAVALGLLLGAPAPSSGPMKCQSRIIKTLLAYNTIALKATAKCVDKQNVGKLPGPCPDTTALLKIQKKADVSSEKIGSDCTMGDLASLGFPG